MMPSGIVRRGFLTSCPTIDAISNPENAKHIDDHRLIVVNTSSRGTSSDGANDVAEPKRRKRDRAADDQQQRRESTSRRCRGAAATLPALQADDVERGAEPEEAEDEDHRIETVLGEAFAARAEHQREIRRREEQQRREVEQVVDPHAPAADEPVQRAERAAHPGVDAALLRMAARQLDQRAARAG